ncbi:MAG: hypothetical protein ACI4RA_09350 [Kiritimatiellia bacterium]
MKIEWKKALAMCAFALAVSPLAAADVMPRSEWHGLVSDCAQNPQTMRETMAKVAPEDQVALLAEVNEAISRMPGSDEVKSAKFYAASHAAVQGTAKGNLAYVLAEIFATVPPEFLTDINEKFAKEVFSRTANNGRTFTDAEYVALATNTLAIVNARCEKTENAGVRETFAILMFLRASNGTPANLAEMLVATMPNAKNRELAMNEWIKPAMGDGQEQTYDPMLGAAQAGEEPDHAVVTLLTGSSDAMVGMLGDLAAMGSDMATPTEKMGAGAFRAPPAWVGIAGTAPDIGLNRVPRAYASDDESPYYTHKRGSHPGGEPSPYAGQ